MPTTDSLIGAIPPAEPKKTTPTSPYGVSVPGMVPPSLDPNAPKPAAGSAPATMDAQTMTSTAATPAPGSAPATMQAQTMNLTTPSYGPSTQPPPDTSPQARPGFSELPERVQWYIGEIAAGRAQRDLGTLRAIGGTPEMLQTYLGPYNPEPTAYRTDPGSGMDFTELQAYMANPGGTVDFNRIRELDPRGAPPPGFNTWDEALSLSTTEQLRPLYGSFDPAPPPAPAGGGAFDAGAMPGGVSLDRTGAGGTIQMNDAAQGPQFSLGPNGTTTPVGPSVQPPAPSGQAGGAFDYGQFPTGVGLPNTGTPGSYQPPPQFDPSGYGVGGDSPVSINRIDPNNPLRGSSILPGQSGYADLRNRAVGEIDGMTLGGSGGYENFRDRAAGAIEGMTLPGQGRIAQTDSSGALAALEQARGMVSTPAAQQAREMALRNLQQMEGPDRGTIAAQTLDLMRRESEDDFGRDVRGVGEKNAAWGRMGSGMVTTDLADVVDQREKYFARAGEGLALDAAGRTLDDRRSILDASLGAGGQFTNEDLGRSDAFRAIGLAREGIQRRDRGELVGERDFAAGQDRDRAALAQGRASAFSGLAGQESGRDRDRASLAQGRAAAFSDLSNQEYGQDRGIRDEFRGERSYQDELSREAMDRRVQQMMLEDQLLNSSFGREMDWTNMLGRYGYGGADPYNAYQDAAAVQRSGASDAYGSIGDAAYLWALGRGG